MPVLEALKSNVWIAWWRMEGKPSSSRLIRTIDCTPTYRLRLSEDFERYWRENGHYKTIRRVRNRCRELTLEVNTPGSAEWTIKNWEAKWRENPDIEAVGLSDRLAVAGYLENRGLHFTLMLTDQGKPVGGATMTVHHQDVVAGVLYRDPGYDQYGVGDRLIDLSFAFAAQKGFDTFDIGGGHEYKKRWARQEGERWLFNLCPESLFRAKQAITWAQGLLKKADRPTSGHIPAE